MRGLPPDVRDELEEMIPDIVNSLVLPPMVTVPEVEGLVFTQLRRTSGRVGRFIQGRRLVDFRRWMTVEEQSWFSESIRSLLPGHTQPMSFHLHKMRATLSAFTRLTDRANRLPPGATEIKELLNV